MAELKTKRWNSFTIGTMLFLVFCCGGLFAGFRFGASLATEKLIEEQAQQRLSNRDRTQVRVYLLAELLESDDEKASESIRSITKHLNDLITDKRAHIEYVKPGRISATATLAHHDLIIAYLNGWRDHKSESGKE